MIELSKSGFSNQLLLYLRNKGYQKAYELGQEFVKKYPNELVAHFLFSKSAFWSGKYRESAESGRKAYNLAKTPEDMLACALLASTAYYELKEYSKGLELLKTAGKTQTSEELETLLFLFFLAMNDDAAAIEHASILYKLNKKAGEALIKRMVKRR